MDDRRSVTGRPDNAVAKTDLDAAAARFGPAAHGVADWPFRTSQPADRVPLPDGRPWPRLRIITLGQAAGPAWLATQASVNAQDYPDWCHDVVSPDEAAARLPGLVSEASAEALLLLRPGDLLAPGALLALGLHFALTGADVVAGLRIVFDEAPLGLDALAAAPGPLTDPNPPEGPLAPFRGGEVLLSRTLVHRAGGLEPAAPDPVVALWPHLVRHGARFDRIGRPVLLQCEPDHVPPPMAPGLSVAILTDQGYSGGAGIAHRRLADALALAGHRVSDHQLTAESPPAAAEWVEAFPNTERRLLTGGYDLILAGNLHGATRRTTILRRLGQRIPVALVLHDLFPLSGRCASPSGCPILPEGCDARCPSPTAYPQLARSRIAGVYAEKHAILAEASAPLLLAASDWTEAAARDLAPETTPIARIDLAFPTGVFRPQDRQNLRRQLRLPLENVLVMFAAAIADAPGKGTSELAALLRRIARPGLSFVAVGRLDDPASLDIPNLIVAGPISEETVLARWYGACDLYITASRQETFGQTAVEAGLCGTPTVSYDATGLATAVIDRISGRLAPVAPIALEAALRDLIADVPARRQLGFLGRIALESRNSHAAAAMRLNDILVARHILPPSAGAARLPFTLQTLSQFAMAETPAMGRVGTIPALSSPLVRFVRRMKQAVLGREMPLWLRWVLYIAAILRMALDHRGSRPASR
ncbi:glycosyltransferase [Methylobacterium sp. 37f]|nr:glycosyltransferase [Methylobacterium sp. 37f]